MTAADYTATMTNGSDPKVYGGRWQLRRKLGKGGQGTVYEVADFLGIPPRAELVRMIAGGLREASTGVYAMSPDIEKFSLFIEALQRVIAIGNAPSAALKELLPLEESVNAKTAVARMKHELDAMKSVDHPALIKVLDADLDQHWFVMQYFRNGPLARQPTRFESNVVGSLKAIRPIVEAVATLHRAGIVHRDIKWDNIFIDDAGGLVLGDCGLAIKLDAADRVTDTYEKVGSTAWMPVWAYGERLEAVQPNFDVFSLGKLLWCMITGRPPFPIWQFDKPQYDVRRLVDDRKAHYVHRILRATVVDEPAKCLSNGAEMLEMLDSTIEALNAHSQMPSQSVAMSCQFCGIGTYEAMPDHVNENFRDPTDRRVWYRCQNCAHLAVFFWKGGKPPDGWLN